MRKNKVILWVNSLMNAPHHDNGAFLFVWDEYVGINSERLDREKYSCGYKYKTSQSWVRVIYDYDGAQACIEYCLEYFELEYSDIDILVYLEWIPDEVEKRFPQIKRKHGIFDHHITHVYSSFFNSWFDEAAVIVVDGQGKRIENGKDTMVLQSIYDASIDWWIIKKKETIWKGKNRIGIGTCYEMVTRLLWLWSEGTTMWLSSYSSHTNILGGPLLSKIEENIYLNPQYIQGIDEGQSKFLKPDTFQKQLWVSEDVLEKEKIPYWFSSHLASQMQSETEQVLISLAQEAYDLTGRKNLCLVWGVALNSVANTKILQDSPFSNVFILPSTDDSWLALWAAMYGRKLVYGESDLFRVPNFYFWKEWSQEDYSKVLNTYSDYCSFKKHNNTSKFVASKIAEGNIIAWFQWGSETGPRALWNRSILADPRKKQIRDRVNIIKKREWWRPLAPVVISEKKQEYFHISKDSDSYKYMLLVVGVLAEKQAILEWITHIDGTARIQSLDKTDNSLLYSLLSEFENITGIPILINTSFNSAWEPIIETPEDAMKMFLSSDLDYLILWDYCISKESLVESFAFSPSVVLQDRLYDSWKWEIKKYEYFIKNI